MRRWWLFGGSAAAALVLIIVLVLAIGGDDDGSTGGAATSSSQVPAGPTTTPSAAPGTVAAPPPAPPPAPVPPPVVDPAALPGLLLSPAQIGQRMGAPGMTASGPVETAMIKGNVTPVDCAGAWGPVHETTYQGSGYTGMAAQAVDQMPTYKVAQGVVSFPDAAAAKAFYDRQVADWNACKLVTITASYNGGQAGEATLSVPSTTGDVLTMMVVSITSKVAGMQCERAMTVRGNVVVDVRACSPTIGSAGWNLARDIGDEVTGPA